MSQCNLLTVKLFAYECTAKARKYVDDYLCGFPRLLQNSITEPMFNIDICDLIFIVNNYEIDSYAGDSTL